jgi:hypothetical protein
VIERAARPGIGRPPTVCRPPALRSWLRAGCRARRRELLARTSSRVAGRTHTAGGSGRRHRSANRSAIGRGGRRPACEHRLGDPARVQQDRVTDVVANECRNVGGQIRRIHHGDDVDAVRLARLDLLHGPGGVRSDQRSRRQQSRQDDSHSGLPYHRREPASSRRDSSYGG